MREVIAAIIAAWLAISAAVPSRQVRVTQECLDAPLAPSCMP